MAPAFLPAATSIFALVFAVALLDQWRERRAGLPADLGDRDAVLRHRRRVRGDRRRERLE